MPRGALCLQGVIINAMRDFADIAPDGFVFPDVDELKPMAYRRAQQVYPFLSTANCISVVDESSDIIFDVSMCL